MVAEKCLFLNDNSIWYRIQYYIIDWQQGNQAESSRCDDPNGQKKCYTLAQEIHCDRGL